MRTKPDRVIASHLFPGLVARFVDAERSLKAVFGHTNILTKGRADSRGSIVCIDKVLQFLFPDKGYRTRLVELVTRGFRLVAFGAEGNYEEIRACKV